MNRLLIFLLSALLQGCEPSEEKTTFKAPYVKYGVTDLAIGGAFPLKAHFEPEEPDRPTKQFRVPNKDQLSDIYPEYEVVILRDPGVIAVIIAKREFLNPNDCTDSKKSLEERIKNYKSKSDNLKLSLDCIVSEDSPFHTLTLEIRGKKEDELLKAAWDDYFSSKK